MIRKLLCLIGMHRFHDVRQWYNANGDENYEIRRVTVCKYCGKVKK